MDFSDPKRLRPGLTQQVLTERAAASFAQLAQGLRERGHDPVSGYPKRPVPRDEAMAKELKKRTLTNLYNDRPQWLDDAHKALDVAVAAGREDIGEEEAMGALLGMNLGG